MRLPRIRFGRFDPEDVHGAIFWFGIGVFLASLASFCSGCATFGPPRPPTFPAGIDRAGEEQAAWVVWHDVYKREDMPPLVRWITGQDLDCDDQRSGTKGFMVLELDPSDPDAVVRMRCDQGDTTSTLETRMAWHGNELSFSETVMCHEFEHAELLRRGIFIGHHERPDFFTRIDQCNAALRAAGR